MSRGLYVLLMPMLLAACALGDLPPGQLLDAGGTGDASDAADDGGQDAGVDVVGEPPPASTGGGAGCNGIGCSGGGTGGAPGPGSGGQGLK